MFNCVICIDDVNPVASHRLLGTKVESWLSTLNADYGCKFTIFAPANYHGIAPLSQNVEWVTELLSLPYVEMAAHGYLHQTNDIDKFGECEFAQNLTSSEIHDKIDRMFSEWDAVGYIPKGWRNPGWLCTSMSKSILESKFDWVALHKIHNMNMRWDCTEFYGHTGIHELEVDVQQSNYITFQSHIHGDRNDNTWTSDTYNQFRMALDTILKSHELNFKTFSELCIKN